MQFRFQNIEKNPTGLEIKRQKRDQINLAQMTEASKNEAFGTPQSTKEIKVTQKCHVK